MLKTDTSNNGLVSIITPTYNSANTIENTIKSAINQSYPWWQMIIVDDASTDDTVDIIKNWQTVDNRILLIQLDYNSGAAIARNRAIHFAIGRYIAFLDSDDQWKADKLLKQIDFMRSNNADLSFTGYEKIDGNNEHIGYVGVPSAVSYKALLKSNIIGCLTAIYDTKHIGKVYMPEIRTRQDYGLWLDILKNHTAAAYGLNEVLAVYSVRSNSISSNKKKAAFNTFKLYRDIEKLGNVKSVYYFCHYVIRGLVKTKFPELALRLKLNKTPNNIH
ncbi:glycosyltransferase family 2 protein [Psychrobacter sp. AOP29-E1-4]|uniref:glycosyltransferase family 2 protein n=1 Tax=Psychrobacter sp. AOP29-E1-4 TaxID=3457703 RepID=UPI004036D09E